MLFVRAVTVPSNARTSSGGKQIVLPSPSGPVALSSLPPSLSLLGFLNQFRKNGQSERAREAALSRWTLLPGDASAVRWSRRRNGSLVLSSPHAFTYNEELARIELQLPCQQ